VSLCVREKDGQITMQQIAWQDLPKKEGLAEVQDDWSCATFWYEPVGTTGKAVNTGW
jgi:hypothetical protein